MMYRPNPPPAAGDLVRYTSQELQRVASALGREVRLDVLTAAPRGAQNGMIVYADGTIWNPGSGEGFYGYQAGAWVKL